MSPLALSQTRCSGYFFCLMDQSISYSLHVWDTSNKYCTYVIEVNALRHTHIYKVYKNSTA